MTKTSAYRDVKHAITNGILRSNEVFTPSSLETIDDPQTLIALSKKNLEGIHNLTRSLEVNMRYHQGRAIAKSKQDSTSYQDSLGLTKYEIDLAERVYNLFFGYEWLMPYYFGKVLQIGKLPFSDIGLLREMLSDPINGELGELLDFSGVDFSFVDEASSEGYQDVAYNR
jgi:hypothetical protein